MVSVDPVEENSPIGFASVPDETAVPLVSVRPVALALHRIDLLSILQTNVQRRRSSIATHLRASCRYSADNISFALTSAFHTMAFRFHL